MTRDDCVLAVDDDGNLEPELGDAGGDLIDGLLVVPGVVLVWL